jgi:hypothetical protein
MIRPPARRPHDCGAGRRYHAPPAPSAAHLFLSRAPIVARHNSQQRQRAKAQRDTAEDRVRERVNYDYTLPLNS